MPKNKELLTNVEKEVYSLLKYAETKPGDNIELIIQQRINSISPKISNDYFSKGLEELRRSDENKRKEWRKGKMEKLELHLNNSL